MKTISPSLKSHYEQDTTTLARCWKCKRVDNVVFGFTSLDIDLEIDGVTYVAATGFTPSALDSRLELAVPNMELSGFLDSESITERDILAGLWDNCEIEIFEVNYKDLSVGRLLLASGKTGNVSVGQDGFNVELRGLSQALQQPVSAFYTRTCTATYGDSKCTIDVESRRVTGTVSAVTNRAKFTAGLGQVNDYYSNSILKWLTGMNTGTSCDIATYTGGAFVLNEAVQFNIQAGDTFTVVPGCLKRMIEDCKTINNNILNFRGFHYTPLNDKILAAGGLE